MNKSPSYDIICMQSLDPKPTQARFYFYDGNQTRLVFSYDDRYVDAVCVPPCEVDCRVRVEGWGLVVALIGLNNKAIFYFTTAPFFQF